MCPWTYKPQASQLWHLLNITHLRQDITQEPFPNLIGKQINVCVPNWEMKKETLYLFTLIATNDVSTLGSAELIAQINLKNE